MASAVNGVATFGNLAINALAPTPSAPPTGKPHRSHSNPFIVAAGTSVYLDFQHRRGRLHVELHRPRANGGGNTTSLSWGAGFGVQDQPGPAAGGGIQSSGSVRDRRDSSLHTVEGQPRRRAGPHGPGVR